jgi:methionine synthase II (cobalamin-independent)
MVEYFGEQLDGFFYKNGWVQSYGSRCVKPRLFMVMYRKSNDSKMANLHNPYSKWVKRIWSRNNLVVCT